MAVTLPTNLTTNHAPTAGELAQILAAIRLGADRLKFATALTSDSAAIGAETMVSAAATNFTWVAGRAYRLSLTGRVSVSAANTEAIFKYRKGTTTGATLLADLGSIKVVATGNVQHVNLVCYIRNATGSDVVQTVQPSLTGGGGNVTWSGTAIPRGWLIEDIGEAADIGTLGVQI